MIGGVLAKICKRTEPDVQSRAKITRADDRPSSSMVIRQINHDARVSPVRPELRIAEVRICAHRMVDSVDGVASRFMWSTLILLGFACLHSEEDRSSADTNARLVNVLGILKSRPLD